MNSRESVWLVNARHDVFARAWQDTLKSYLNIVCSHPTAVACADSGKLEWRFDARDMQRDGTDTARCAR